MIHVVQGNVWRSRTMTRVHIELQRVQTWLFAVPRLRAMVGANTLLGEVLEIELPALARRQTSWRLAPALGTYPAAASGDPLSDHDDPAADAGDGILSRHGGHFEVTLASGACAFAEAADALLRRNVPGLRFRISIDKVPRDTAGATLSTELPVLAPCEWTGRGLASLEIRQGLERAMVSPDVRRRHDAARRAEKGQAQDLASLLAAKTRLRGLLHRRPVVTFGELAGSGYLAVIYADGNGVGGAAVSSDVERAAFFHRNRWLLRKALQAAINTVCEKTTSAPVLPLMLGGDDVLVVSRAEAALPFVVSLCQTLANIQQEQPGEFDLTLGVGVVLARPTIPIQRLHDVVERLAASAKRRYRGFTGTDRRSVVDWAVYTTTWADDPEEVRRRDWVRGCGQDKRVLSQRPVDVLGHGLSSLGGLLDAAAALEGAPRSQLRYLVDQLARGRTLSELAFKELSKEARDAFQHAGIGDTIWDRSDPDGPLLTAILDLVEIYEIRRLGRADTAAAADERDILEEEESPHAQA